MKSLELNLNKRLLIVELNEDYIGYKLKKICKGYELTQSLVEPFLDKKTDDYGIYWYRDYTVVDESIHDAYTFLNPKESFISAIESKGWYWGKDLPPKPIYNVINYGALPGAYRKYVSDLNEWKKAEYRTFNPEKCIIFEIL